MNFIPDDENPNDFGTLSLVYVLTDDIANSISTVETLIRAGADINAQNNRLQTPLHVAVQENNWIIAGLLIDNDADVNIEESRGNTALHLTMDMHWSKKEQDEGYARLWMIKKLLSHRADPNASNVNGETPLLLAVKCGDLASVSVLLASGANVHCRNIFSETCLHLISFSHKNHIAILFELLTHGACANCYDDFGQTALDVWLMTDKVSVGRNMVQWFLKLSTLINWSHKTTYNVKSENLEKFRRFEELSDRCHKEVCRMKSNIYSNGTNLCQFALNGCKVSDKDECNTSVFDEVWNTLMEDEFPTYYELIELHLEKTFLEKRLSDMKIYTRNKDGEVCLNSYAISNIASYLPERDLLSLARAYANTFNDSNKI